MAKREKSKEKSKRQNVGVSKGGAGSVGNSIGWIVLVSAVLSAVSTVAAVWYWPSILGLKRPGSAGLRTKQLPPGYLVGKSMSGARVSGCLPQPKLISQQARSLSPKAAGSSQTQVNVRGRL